MRLLAIAISFLLLAGCINYKFGEFTLISTRTIDFSKTYQKGEKKIFGEDARTMYFIILNLKLKDTDIAVAVNNALNDNCAEYLSEATVTLEQVVIPLVYAKNAYRIEGYPWYLEGDARQACLKNKGGK